MGIKQIKTGDTVHNILPLYGTCSTAAGTVAKVVSLDNFVLETGSRISVKFTYANSVANPTLNVNSTGAKAIYYNGGTMNSTSEYWLAGSIMDFIYDGTHWVMMGVSKNTDTDTNTTYTIATGDSNGQIKITPSNADAYNVGVKGLGAAAYKEVTDSTSASAISTGTNLVTERDVYYGLPKINNSNSYTRSTTIYAPTAGGTSKYFLCGAGTTKAPTWASPATARTNLELSYGTAAPSGTPSNGAVYFREDIHATLPITEGGTGATSVSAARANLGLNHVGAAAVCKSDSRTISITTAGGFAVIPMVQSALQTNDSNFTISNNGIQCPYSGYVYITGAIYISTTGQAGCYIYKNGDNGELHSQYHTCSGCISSGGMLVPVTAGDIITMKARSSVAKPTIGGNNKGTHLSIIYVA